MPVVDLTPLPAALEVVTEPPSTVTVDGVYRGSTPLKLTLSPWEAHEIAFASSGYESVKRTVEMEPGESDIFHGEVLFNGVDYKPLEEWLAKAAAAQGAPALALTDHGNLFGAIDFYESCRKEGVKPILGFEAYVAPQSRHDRERNPVAAWHLTLLARNERVGRELVEILDAASENTVVDLREPVA